MLDNPVKTYVAVARGRRGLSVAQLAQLSGLTRQSIYSIEAGGFMPSTAVALRLARALETSVEQLFELTVDPPPPSEDRVEDVQPLPGAGIEPGQPVQLCRVGGRLIAAASSPINWALPVSDAVLAGGSRARLFDPDAEFDNRLLIAGCDPAISILARHAARAGVEVVAAHRNSTAALELLESGMAHVAGVHLQANVPEIRKRFAKRSAAVFSFAVWEQGLVIARGNPKDIQGIDDLARRNVTIVNREAGAGSRRLLDAKLAAVGIRTNEVRGYDREAQGHLPAAWQVKTGAADCCIATKAAARVFGLDFKPLATERYDLAIRRRDLDLPAVVKLLEVLARADFRREVEKFGGYDTSAGGDRVL
jgi:putative molybdopterin biosynthesis protein